MANHDVVTLSVHTVKAGPRIGTARDSDYRICDVVLQLPVTVEVELDWTHVLALVNGALRSKGRRAKASPIRVRVPRHAVIQTVLTPLGVHRG